MREAAAHGEGHFYVVVQTCGRDVATRGEHPDVVGYDACAAIAQSRRGAQHGRGGYIPLEVRTRRDCETLVGLVIYGAVGRGSVGCCGAVLRAHPVAAQTEHEREFIFQGVSVFGIHTRLDVTHVVVREARPHRRRLALLRYRAVEHLFSAARHLRRSSEDHRRAGREVVGVHEVEPPCVVVGVVIVQAEVCVLLEIVVVGDEGHVRTQFVLGLLVIHRGTDGHADLEIGVCAAVGYARAVNRLLLQHLVVERLAVIHLAAQAVFTHIFPSPAHLRAVLGLPQPFVGYVYLVALGQVAESVVGLVIRLGVHRAVGHDDRREAFVGREGERCREVYLGAQLAVEIEVEEQTLVIGWLAVLHVDLSSDGLVARRHR